MDSRKILEIYKLINDRSIKPVSAWPTIADIPQGAVVLDTDGVVKQKAGGFLNEGVDYVSADRPAWINQISPNQSFSIFTLLRIKKTDAVAQYILSIASGDAAETQQLALLFRQGTNWASLRVGGVEKTGAYVLPASDTIISICITSNGTVSDLWINGIKIISGLLNGAYISTNNLNIFGYSFRSDYNAESLFFQSSIFSGYSINGTSNGLSLLDKYDMNKWDGSNSGLSDMGFPYTVTKGTPFTEKSYALVPVSML